MFARRFGRELFGIAFFKAFKKTVMNAANENWYIGFTVDKSAMMKNKIAPRLQRERFR